MDPIPSGAVVRTDSGYDLVLRRTFSAPADEVWSVLTDPVRTAVWYGPWRGEAQPGRTIDVQMSFEEGAPWGEYRIDACEPPSRLAMTTLGEWGGWRLEAQLSHHDGTTTLTFIQHVDDTEGLGDIGPGWEYYLDRLASALHGLALPQWDAYYPVQREYYENAVAGARRP